MQRGRNNRQAADDPRPEPALQFTSHSVGALADSKHKRTRRPRDKVGYFTRTRGGTIERPTYQQRRIDGRNRSAIDSGQLLLKVSPDGHPMNRSRFIILSAVLDFER